MNSSYKKEYEHESHWELRKKFMEMYKDQFPEDRLACLAQVFINVEFLGCTYPEETMNLVADLSQVVAKEFREERLGGLKRKLVQASDAAEAKAKRKTNCEFWNQMKNNRNHSVVNDIYSTVGNTEKPDIKPTLKIPDTFNKQKNTTARKRLIESDDEDENTAVPQFFNFKKECRAPEKKAINLYSGLMFGDFVLYDWGGRNAIRLSGQKCGICVEEEEMTINGERVVKTIVGGIAAGTGYGTSLKEAKALSFENAFNFLKENCYTIKPKLNPDRIDITKDSQTIICNLKTTQDQQKIDSNNIGFKMMQKFGWSGGGLGLRTQGIENPIEYLVKNNRRGLGSECDDFNVEYFQKMLANYVNSDDIRDLYFESKFTKEEREILHQVAAEKKLKSASHGDKFDRFLVISKKTITPHRIIEEILINGNDMYANKYEVRVPKQKAHLFPDHTFQEPKLNTVGIDHQKNKLSSK